MSNTPIVVHGNIINRERAQFSDATQSAAVRELVDNSVDANATMIEITFDARAASIIINDDGDGCAEINRFFDIGDSTKRVASAGHIGRYGIGGTWAGMYLSDVQEVASVKRGEEVMRKAVMRWTDVADGRLPFEFNTVCERPIKAREMLHGTCITLRGVRNGNEESTNIFRPASQRKLRETLSKTYGAAIARDGLCISVNDELLEQCKPPIRVSGGIDLQLDTQWNGRRLRIHARHMAEEETWRAGVYVAYRGRLLNKNARPWDSWTRGAPVWLWVDLFDHEELWHLSWNKDDFEERNELLEYVMCNPEVAAFMSGVDLRAQDMDSMILGHELSAVANAMFAPLSRVLEKRPGKPGETGTVVPISSGIERRRATIVDHDKPGTIDEPAAASQRHAPYRIVFRDLGERGPMYSVALDRRERKQHNAVVEYSLRATVTLNTHDKLQHTRLRDRGTAFALVAQAVLLKLAREQPHDFDTIYAREMGEIVDELFSKDECALKLAHVLMLRSQLACDMQPRARKTKAQS